MTAEEIRKKIKDIRSSLPAEVIIEAAVKGRLVQEIETAIESGIDIIGENYVQEALIHKQAIRKKASRWHFIGRLQKNKINKAILLFDMIETLSSWDLAVALNERLKRTRKRIDVLVEVNIAREPQKNGVFPEEAETFVKKLSLLGNIQVKGLMTMGPNLEKEEMRPYFRNMRQIFEGIRKLSLEGVKMEYLSMGMSSSFKVAVEEGANLVRLGRAIFGPRPDY